MQQYQYYIYISFPSPFLCVYSLSLPETRPFVLELWKFLHISRIQNEHSIPDSFMEELTPLPLIAGRRESGRMEAEERLVKKIKVI